MSIANVRRGTGLETVYATVRGQIIDGSLGPGDRLTEPALAERLNVSRTPVREALRLLLAEGLVHRQLSGGLRVAPLRREDLARIFDIRARLEGLLARDASLRMTLEARSRLEKLLERMDRAEGDESEILRLGREFHATVAECADNPWCSQLLHEIRGHVDRYKAWATSDPGRPAKAAVEHRAIFDALMSGDPDAADRVMQEHVVSSAVAARRALPPECPS
ncbi:GntR family transcriptional regulator [Cellulomonas fimi]|uniref:GntR family transcriptional regulator n=1 Tax=Cellulomonas fimi TaxID=1708 RepID=A0A7Y0LYG3_CELFI|nr:GntR family transcriptional regulator [Cellulomonas fimi]NMR19057.1 GntR family transcriptional regulator [Cellulomonas fimi]